MKKQAACLVILLLAVALVPSLAVAGSKDSKKKDSAEAKVVDSGSFGVFFKGRRIATETFQVKQRADYSVTTSDLKLEDGSAQTSELQTFPNGNLRKYMWRALAPEKAHSVLEPGDQILNQEITVGSQKPQTHPYILPASTIVLDDYIFVHRELLAWRYLGSGCIPGQRQCSLTKAKMGIIVPRQQTPDTVTMEYAGREKLTVRGVEQELNRFLLKNDDQEWQLWLNDQYKLIRILISSENTEVLRD
ncbi:MAG: hypothetical protein L0Z53_17735 [Acidobacteriales bacterium]|nr:hypothetical protein [Terriglobales bacterium]